MNKYLFYVILVNNEFPENVGFICRTMGNFNIFNLVLINPLWNDFKKAEWFSYTKAGIKILNKCRKYSSLSESIKKLNLDLTIGFTRRAGKYREILTNYKNYFKNFFQKINYKKIKIGLIFGKESSGLSDDDIKSCNNLLYIPTSSKSPSLNLSHAISIILNEIFFYTSSSNNINSNLVLDVEKIFKPSTIKEREVFYQKIFNEIGNKNLFINDDLNTFKRMFERIFSSPLISKKDLKLLNRLLMRFLHAKKNNNI
jgi:TrmH family RNA methyltransferase